MRTVLLITGIAFEEVGLSLEELEEAYYRFGKEFIVKFLERKFPDRIFEVEEKKVKEKQR